MTPDRARQRARELFEAIDGDHAEHGIRAIAAALIAVRREAMEEAGESVGRLIKLAASIARREYLPDLADCGTIHAARKRVELLDGRHAVLAVEIRQIADAIRALSRSASPSERLSESGAKPS